MDPGVEIADEVSYDLFGQTVDEPTSAGTARKSYRDERKQRIQVLVLVKAYPALSTKYGEVVCVAGVRMDSERPHWVRLWPVSFRALEFTDQFSKYQYIHVDVFRPASDRRPESWSPQLPTLTLGAKLPTSQRWQARRQVVEPLVVESMCWIQRQQAAAGTSLGVFRPAVVDDFEVTPADDADLIAAKIRGEQTKAQSTLFGPDRGPLEPSPYKFKYHYKCAEDRCGGHHQTVIDWEAVQAARQWRSAYDEVTLRQKLRDKWLGQLCAPNRDTMFYVGNMHQNPVSFLVLGVFWPPLGPIDLPQASLFE
ncbi:MAG: hypothetical protein QOI76_3602 [Frankiales bacterium]|nr:hypothetical protein [Frankiales bacterium]